MALSAANETLMCSVGGGAAGALGAGCAAAGAWLGAGCAALGGLAGVAPEAQAAVPSTNASRLAARMAVLMRSAPAAPPGRVPGHPPPAWARQAAPLRLLAVPSLLAALPALRHSVYPCGRFSLTWKRLPNGS